ncbi:hypothetical protein ABFX02_13G004900 [Erythranthe guttata]
MKLNGIRFGRFLTSSSSSSPNCKFRRRLGFFLSQIRDFGKISVADRNFLEKFNADLQNVNDRFEALNLCATLSTTNPLPSVITFNRLLSRTVNNLKEYSTAIAIFKRICNLGISVDVYTLNIAANSFCLSNQVNQGFSIMGSFFKRGFAPDAFTLGTLLNGLIIENRISDAQELFDKIVREEACEVNAFFYGIMIYGLCGSGNTSMAIEYLRVMEKHRYKADVRIYTMIIDSLCKSRKIDSAMEFFVELLGKGIKPNVVTYTALICGFCSSSRWKEVNELLNDMIINRKIYPNIVTFGTLINAYCKEGLMDEAERVINIMKEKNLAPDLVSYCALMGGYCTQGRLDEARRVFDLMVYGDNNNIGFNVYSFNILINAYIKNMQMEEAMGIFHEMRRKGVEPNIATYNFLLAELFNDGRLSTAMELFDKLQAVWRIPNSYTYSVVLRGLCKNGEVERALLLLEELEKKGENLRTSYYNTIMDGFCRLNELEKLGVIRAIFRGLSCKKLEPDVVSYNILIKGCCQHGLMDEAIDLLEEMEGTGLLPDEVTYNNIVRGFLARGNYDSFDDAVKFLDKMQERKLPPDESTSELLFELLGKIKHDNVIEKLGPSNLRK